MKRALLVLAATAAALTPLTGLLALEVLLTDSNVNLTCQTGTILRPGAVPTSLTAHTATGVVVTLGQRQLAHAATILTVAGRTKGAGVRGARIALMAALTESDLRMLANPADTYSLDYANDGIGRDHDSLGLFQMRPSTGWGTVGQLMDPTYQAEAFFGGPTSPNTGSPAGLLDIPDWTELTDGQAAQAVEVSAYPGRYTDAGPVADRIIEALTAQPPGAATTIVPESTAVGFPLPAGTWTLSARFGPRIDPVTGRPGFHHGTDLAAAAGTPIRSATDGRVVTAGLVTGTGTITVRTTIDGRPTAVTYLHMTKQGIAVHTGETVTAGEVIGAVGSTGHSTGPHLHFQVQPGGLASVPIDSLRWLRAHHASSTDTAPAAACQ